MDCKKGLAKRVSDLPVAPRAGEQTARSEGSTLLRRAEKRFNLSTSHYAQLASFRYALRGFLRFSEALAVQEGLTSQHYQAMLVLRGWPDGQPVSIGDLAKQLQIKHNSAVGLVDRLVLQGLVMRKPSSVDRRKVELRLLLPGQQVLARLAAMHRGELRRIGPFMRRFFSDLAHEKEVGTS